jgi:putative ABC transport system permease protein
MFKNYLKVALRNLWKSKGFSAINIIGLATGLGVCLLIVLYVVDELSYDRYNEKADRIYRLDADLYFNNTLFSAAVSPRPMGPTMVKDYPDIEQMTRINVQGDIMVKKGGNFIQDHHLVFADSTLFKVFTLPMLQGDPNTALSEPNSIVLDESVARRYFNSTNVVGKTIELENHTLCKVTGVISDMPRQSHFHFSFIRTLRDIPEQNTQHDDWLSNNFQTYVVARPGVSRERLQSHVDQAVITYLGRQLQDMLHVTLKDMEKTGAHFRYHVTPLADIHLHSNKSAEFEPNGNISYVYVFSFIAILILVIACVNFMNLSTARSANRAKEVGIRKVAGSTRGDLIIQFLTESMLLSLFSLVLALGIALLLLPMFNTLAGKEMHAATLFSGRFLPLLVLLVALVGVLAGSYPAFYLSSFQPIQVLKGKIASGLKGSSLRSILVVGQFVISIGLIIGTIVIYRQLNFIRSREVGFNRDQVLVIHNAYAAGDPVKNYRKDLLTLSGVADATLSGDMPTSGGSFSQNGWSRMPSFDSKDLIVLTNLFVDDHYIPTLGMQMTTGRSFNPEKYPTDSMGVVINESAAQLMGFKQPLNEKLYRPNGVDSSGKFTVAAYHVIGVVKDFNYSSAHNKILPLIMNLADNRGSLAVRLKGGNIPSLVKQIEGRWSAMAQGVPFSYTFMDADFNNLYKAEAQTGQVFVTFAVFAILIASLGLFGLVTYAAEQRTKEIGIRKVLGANVGGIVALLSRDFVKLVLIASVIAFPVAWWAMNQWLQSFAYRVGVSWWIFAVAGLAAVMIALVTVSLQTIRAALANPIRSLRSE